MVNFGQAIGTACLAFLATNVDDAFVLVTFFAETASDPNSALTPWKIVIGQYVGFTVIFAISMIGFVVSLVMPTEPIGFLGLLPIMLGVWKLFDLLLPVAQAGDDPDGELAALRSTKARGYRAILKVALITLMNGGDNIGTYIPLFSQVNPPAVIAVYAVVFYIMLGLWCLVGWLLIRQRHVAKLAEKYVAKLIPFLYMGLGTFIIVESKAYPWSIEKIDTEVV
ncbi:cadmium resistance transporter, partial [Microdochium bolleyi]